MSCRLKSCLTLFFVLSLLVPVAHAQEVRASITGLVVDPTGAPIAGANVTATNVATNMAVVVKTNESGNFVAPFLLSGKYMLTVEADGFKKFVRQDIVLQAQDKVRIDAKMEVGQVNSSVTVTGAVSQLETETASRAQVLATELVSNIPTQGRNSFQVAWATAGVVVAGSWKYFSYPDVNTSSTLSINGGRSKGNEVLLDGVSDVRANGMVMSIPSPDAVQEFKVSTNSYDAQYGRTSGGVVSMVTKGGGNQFHGTVFEYFENDKLKANTSELNKAGTARQPFHVNQFGAQVSGPVIIPKVFNGRNRLFWMVSWESNRQRSSDPMTKTLPLMEWRTGDFSTLYNSAGKLVQIYDPYSTKSDGSRTPIVGNKIPASQIDPVAKALLSYYPAPNGIGDGLAHVNNYIVPSRWVASFDQFLGRTDFAVNSKNNVFFRYSECPFQEFRKLVFTTDLNNMNPAEPSSDAPLLRNGRNWTMDWTSTISPRMTFDLRAGLSRWEETTGSTLGADYNPTQLGISSGLVAQFNRLQFPSIGIEDYQGMGAAAAGPNTNDSYSLQPSLNYVAGRHFMKFGADARRYNETSSAHGYPSGSWTFNKAWTQANASKADSTSGNGLATMLLGVPSDVTVNKNIDPAYRHHYFAGFFSDDWKLTSRLTLNFGLRWDIETSMVERYDRMFKGLDLDAESPIVGKVSGLTLKGQALFANVNGQSRSSFNLDKNNWQPRVGLAYRISDKWVIRGGYGLFYVGQSASGTTSGFSRSTSAIVSSNGLTPLSGMTTANPFVGYTNGTLLSPIGSSGGTASFLGESVTTNYLNRTLPYSHQYSIDIQRQLPGEILFEIGYTGNAIRGLPVSFGLNYIPTSELGRRTSTGAIDTSYYTTKITNPLAGLIPNNSTLNASTVTRATLMYAYPQYSSLTLANVPVGRQRYHGMSIKVTKRLSHGLSFLGAYTVAKTLEQTSVLNAQDFSRSDWESTPLVKQSAQDYDAPQKFTLAGIYELPFGKGRKFAGAVHPIMDHLIGGWQVNWNVSYMSGWVVNYPNAAQLTPGSAKLSSSERSMTRWFNTSLWGTSAQESYTLRNYPYLFSDVRRPGYQNWDTSVSKYFPIKEKLKIQFRCEMVNMMNHPWFANMASGGTTVTSAAFGQLDPTQRNLPRSIKLVTHLNW